jgi:hypothetical protein
MSYPGLLTLLPASHGSPPSEAPVILVGQRSFAAQSDGRLAAASPAANLAHRGRIALIDGITATSGAAA